MIKKLQKKINQSLKIDTLTYWSGQNRSERKTTLDYFQKGGGVLIAIKCLDEGVDIPSISHGIIIASSKTKREWIQRSRLLGNQKQNLIQKFSIYLLSQAKKMKSQTGLSCMKLNVKNFQNVQAIILNSRMRYIRLKTV